MPFDAGAFSPAELAYLRLLEGRARQVAATRSWVRKEAVTKAGGVGVATDLAAVEVAPHQPSGVRVDVGLAATGRSWEVVDLDCGPGLVAALACQPHRDLVVRLASWPPGAVTGKGRSAGCAADQRQHR